MVTRRLVITGLAGFGAAASIFGGDATFFGQGRAAANYRGKPSEIQGWMDKWMDDKKALGEHFAWGDSEILCISCSLRYPGTLT
jgi:hypothetical protein